jgi:hypothetical protein
MGCVYTLPNTRPPLLIPAEPWSVKTKKEKRAPVGDPHVALIAGGTGPLHFLVCLLDGLNN